MTLCHPISLAHGVSLAALLALQACVSPAPKSAPAAAVAAPAAASAAATSMAAAASAPRPPAAASASALAVAPPAPGQPPSFAIVIKDAKLTSGLFNLYQKDEKFWLELRAEDFEKSFFLSPKLASGIGENGLFGGMMRRPQMVQFRRLHNLVQLIAVNSQHVAKAGTPLALSVAAAMSPSLLAATPVASQPHPDRKTVLIDANALFVNDMLAIAAELGRTYRQGYGLDGRNSAIVSVRGKPDMVAIEVMNHYATGAIAIALPGAPPGVPGPTTPQALPDARSMFFKLHYSLARLPEQTMAPRRADPRVGYFVRSVNDFSDDLARSPRQHHVTRWRLEKKDPAAELSEPVKPITYWVDRTVPVQYRAAITVGILEWNKAFERIGFKDAVVVKVQPDDADFDTLDFGVASVRWMSNNSPQFGAIGPSHVDPRSGEILDADIALEGLSTRSVRNVRSRLLGSTLQGDWARLMQIAPATGASGHEHDPQRCDHGEFAAEQLGYAMDVLEAQGELDPNGPEAEAFVQAYLKDVTMHEVGHTLGLRHNFRASNIYSDAQLSDPEFTKTHALTGSVMEYAPVNLPLPGQSRPEAFQTTLGPYDHWAIEYAYKVIAPSEEAAVLSAIAARSAEPELAYGTDEDMWLGADPESLQFDLGNDPIAFARKRFEIEQDLFKRQETRQFGVDQDWSALRRSLNYAVRDAGRATGVLLRQIGGVRSLRDFANTGRDPLQVVDAVRQRAALDLLARHVLAAGSFAVSPQLQRRLAPDHLERTEAFFNGSAAAVEPPLAQTVHALRQSVLGQLLGDGLANRMLDNESLVDRGAQTLGLAEMYERVDAEVWSELTGRGDIVAARRELQRDHLNRLVALVLRPAALTRADARALVRGQASRLLKRIELATRKADLSAEARHHLQDSAETLRSALSASLLRAGA